MKKFYLFLVALVVSAFAANAAGPEKLYIFGQDFGGWSQTNGTEMTKVSDGVFTIDNVTGYFRLAEGNASDSYVHGPELINGSEPEVTSGNSYVVKYQNTDKAWHAPSSVKITVTFTAEHEATMVAGEGAGEETFVELYLRGDHNGWSANDDWKFNTTDGVVYTLENKALEADKQFKVADANWGAEQYAIQKEIVLNTTYTLTKGSGDNMKLANGGSDLTITFNRDTKEFKIAGENGGEIVGPVNTLYFHSQPNGSDWSAGSLMTYADGVFTTTVNFDNIQHFMFRTDGVANWNSGDNAYGPAGSNMTVEAGEYAIVRNSNKCYAASLKGDYEVKVDIANGKMTLTAVASAVAHYIHTSTPGTDGDVWQTTGVKVEDGAYEISCPAVNHFIFTKNGALDWDNLNNFYGAGATDVVVAAGGTYSLVESTKKAFNTASLAEGTYTVTVADGKVTVVAKDVVAPEMATIYLSLGADYMLDNNKKAPVATFKGNGVADYTVTMTEADEEYIFLAEFDKNKYSSVNFKVNGVDYPMDSDIAKEHNNELEGDGWYKYIYCTDGDENNNKWSTQSYLTRDRYVELRDSERTGYCVAGSHDAWNLTNEANRKPMTGGICSFASSEMAVGTKFKISYIDPIALNANAADKAQRWWATFNLGIIGPDPFGADVVLDGTNKYVPYNVRVPKKYNHYCKYDWCVSEAGTYYVVIDPEHEVTVLLTFAPSPTLETATNGVYSKSATENEELVSLPFEQHGVAQVREFNISEGTAEITRANSPGEFREEYDVVYYLEADGKVIHKYSDLFDKGELTEIVDITGIVSSDMSELSFYAQYTCKGIGDSKEGEGVVFNSRKTSVEVKTGNVTFEALTAADAPAGFCLVANGATAEGLMNWDAVFAVSFETADQNKFAMYPAFDEVTCAGVEAELVHADHPVLTRKVNGITFDEKALYEKADDFSSYVHSTNSWAEVARNSNKFYFYAANVAQTEDRAEAEKLQLSIQGMLKAIYPFSTQKQQAQAVKGRVAAPAADQLFTFPSENSDFNYEVTAGKNLTSGVSDVELGEAEGEVELYNLQGVRVEGEAAPGLYIRRQGNKVEKIQIR